MTPLFPRARHASRWPAHGEFGSALDGSLQSGFPSHGREYQRTAPTRCAIRISNLTPRFAGPRLGQGVLMLADMLDGSARKRVVAELETRAAAVEPRGLSPVRRRRRLNALVEELVGALKHGGIDGRDARGDRRRSRGRTLRARNPATVRSRGARAAPHGGFPAEAVIVSESACYVSSGAVCEKRISGSGFFWTASKRARPSSPRTGDYSTSTAEPRTGSGTRAGSRADEIVGKTCSELAVTEELGIGPPAEILALARARGSFEVEMRGRETENRFDAVYSWTAPSRRWRCSPTTSTTTGSPRGGWISSPSSACSLAGWTTTRCRKRWPAFRFLSSRTGAR